MLALGAGLDCTASIPVSGLEDYFSCPVCQDWLLPSYSLSCGHMLCSQCSINWLSIRKNCPVCRAHLSSAPSRSSVIESFISEKLLPALPSEDRERLEQKQRTATASKPLLDGIFRSFKQHRPRHLPAGYNTPASALHDILPDQDASDSSSADNSSSRHSSAEVLRALHVQHQQRQHHAALMSRRANAQALPGGPISARILQDEFGTLRLVGMDTSDDDVDLLATGDLQGAAAFEVDNGAYLDSHWLMLQSHHPTGATAPPAMSAAATAPAAPLLLAPHASAAVPAAAAAQPPATAAARPAARSFLSHISPPRRRLSRLLGLLDQLVSGTTSSSSQTAPVVAMPAVPAAVAPTAPAAAVQAPAAPAAVSTVPAAAFGAAQGTSWRQPGRAVRHLQRYPQQQQQQLLHEHAQPVSVGGGMQDQPPAQRQEPPGPVAANAALRLQARPALQQMLSYGASPSGTSAADVFSTLFGPRTRASLT